MRTIRLTMLSLVVGCLPILVAQLQQISCPHMGNTTYCSDAISSQHLGNMTYGFDGTSYQGRATYGANGSTCRRIGDVTYCD